ncbi:MAG: peptide deformylase [Thiohalomonadales bacterium]
MAILKLLHYPDQRLRKIAQPVVEVDSKIQTLVDDLFETMYLAPGIGLAANQANVLKRVIVIDISENKQAPLCLINPKITFQEGRVKMDEGCLSVPGIYEPVDRSERIVVKAQDREGKHYEKSAEGLLAVCIQHEVDHLEGKLFVDYLSEMKRQRIRKKLEKERQRA